MKQTIQCLRIIFSKKTLDEPPLSQISFDDLFIEDTIKVEDDLPLSPLQKVIYLLFAHNRSPNDYILRFKYKKKYL
jgi:hypothetical protein